MWKAAVGLVLTAVVAASAGCVTPTRSHAVFEPPADQALRAMCAMVGSAKAFRFHVDASVDEMSPDGQMLVVSRATDVLVRRPDAIAAKTRSEEGQWSLCYKGKRLSLLREASNSYATIEVPGSIDEMLDFLFEKYGLTLPLADLLFTDPYEALTEDAQTGVYLGVHSVADHPCHHLLITQENVDWQVWIDAGEKPLPRKVAITRKNEPGQPQYTAELSEWDVTPAVADEAFDFKPPAHAKAVDMAELRSEKEQ